jgi:hypothetical protein
VYDAESANRSFLASENETFSRAAEQGNLSKVSEAASKEVTTPRTPFVVFMMWPRGAGVLVFRSTKFPDSEITVSEWPSKLCSREWMEAVVHLVIERLSMTNWNAKDRY